MYTLAPEITERIAEVEVHLASLDPILQDFCTRLSYTFFSHVGVWPRRNAHQRLELDRLDRCLYLTTDLTVEELMKSGFSSNMPWSLEVAASSGGRVMPSQCSDSSPQRYVHIDGMLYLIHITAGMFGRFLSR